MDFQPILNKIAASATDLAFRLVGGILLLTIGRLTIKWLMRLIKNGKGMKKLDAAAERFLTNSIRVILNVALAVSVIALLGVPMTSALAVITSAGVAIGLALQGALGNLAGGIMILIFRPFQLNDFIEIASFSGTVTDIGFFYTKLKTTDNRAITIPNGTVMSAEIVNYSANPRRRVDMSFSVSYGSDVTQVRQILLEEASKHDSVLKDPIPFCRFSEQGENSLHFILRAWVERENYWNVKFDLLESIHNRLAAEGISVPFKQLDVHLIHDDKRNA